jgi:hypothetical protein
MVKKLIARRLTTQALGDKRVGTQSSNRINTPFLYLRWSQK